MEITDIKLRIIILRAEVAGISKEIDMLCQIRCPVCKDSYMLGQVEVKEGDATAAAVYTRHEPCVACSGSGYVCGETPPLIR